MVLTKEAIQAVKLTKRFRRCYDAQEVDILLDEIGEAAEEQCRELEHLRSVRMEYNQMKNQISEALLAAQQTAKEMLEQTRNKCNEELAAMQQRRITLQQEISGLERYKALELEKIRKDLESLLGDPESDEAAQEVAASK
ncbi:DivIVA domain-containing protein [Lacrimispora sphenoides]|uniref:DivIVA protein n=1 Tax=Lacrimispora sphenoides JCM 1415 TaxID=1297793 RepID=A0ABY1CB81_9FIRM|nr:DivIVA domain-containing protein [Lacrimispora sphenoides]SET88193.1 DivIVA protein [[Clostridium] sphenoides JCM 1415]SUY52034.1 DivIVA protein [Lacrimispora sphenoides]